MARKFSGGKLRQGIPKGISQEPLPDIVHSLKSKEAEEAIREALANRVRIEKVLAGLGDRSDSGIVINTEAELMDARHIRDQLRAAVAVLDVPVQSAAAVAPAKLPQGTGETEQEAAISQDVVPEREQIEQMRALLERLEKELRRYDENQRRFDEAQPKPITRKSADGKEERIIPEPDRRQAELIDRHGAGMKKNEGDILRLLRGAHIRVQASDSIETARTTCAQLRVQIASAGNVVSKKPETVVDATVEASLTRAREIRTRIAKAMRTVLIIPVSEEEERTFKERAIRMKADAITQALAQAYDAVVPKRTFKKRLICLSEQLKRDFSRAVLSGTDPYSTIDPGVVFINAAFKADSTTISREIASSVLPKLLGGVAQLESEVKEILLREAREKMQQLVHEKDTLIADQKAQKDLLAGMKEFIRSIQSFARSEAKIRDERILTGIDDLISTAMQLGQQYDQARMMKEILEPVPGYDNFVVITVTGDEVTIYGSDKDQN